MAGAEASRGGGHGRRRRPDRSCRHVRRRPDAGGGSLGRPRRRAAGCRPTSSGPRGRSCPAPTTSERRPRPPSASRVPLARTSPVMVCVLEPDRARRRDVHVAADRADLMIRSVAEVGRDADVAAGRRGGQGVEARCRAGSGRPTPTGPSRSIGCGRGQPARRRTSTPRTRVPRRRPGAGRPTRTPSGSRRADADRMDVAAQGPQGDARGARDVDVEVGGPPRGPTRSGPNCRPRSSSRIRTLPGVASIVTSSSIGSPSRVLTVTVSPSTPRRRTFVAVTRISTSPPASSRTSRVVQGLGRRLGHRVLPSARMASAASSALSSWRDSCSRISRRPAWIDSAVAVASAAAAAGRLPRRRRRHRRWLPASASSRGPKPSARMSASTRSPDGGIADARAPAPCRGGCRGCAGSSRGPPSARGSGGQTGRRRTRPRSRSRSPRSGGG